MNKHEVSDARQPIPAAIAALAYELWLREGRPDGCDTQHWLQAERELGQRNGNGDATTIMPEKLKHRKATHPEKIAVAAVA